MTTSRSGWYFSDGAVVYPFTGEEEEVCGQEGALFS